jgi:hypothetical protein
VELDVDFVTARALEARGELDDRGPRAVAAENLDLSGHRRSRAREQQQ